MLNCFVIFGLPFAHQISRLTGEEVGYNRRLRAFNTLNLGRKAGQAQLQQAISKLIPSHLLHKIRHRKLVRTTEDDELLTGRLFKTL